MKIGIINSKSELFLDLVADLKGRYEVRLYQDGEALLISMHNCDAVLLDFDTNPKSAEKLIKAIRKAEDPRPIIMLCNSLEGSALRNHQVSRVSADVYLTYPNDIEILSLMIEEALVSSEDKTMAISLGGDDGSFDMEDHMDLSLSDSTPEVEDVDNDLDLSIDSIADLDEFSADETLSQDVEGHDEFSFELSDTPSSSDRDEDESSQRIELNEEPISLDEDITMGGIDLSDLTAASENKIQEDFNAQDELSITSDEGDLIESDEELDFSLDLGDDESADNDSYALEGEEGFDFGIDDAAGGVPELPGDSPAFVMDEEDDFQTKLREIDEMLNESTSASLASDEENESDELSFESEEEEEEVDYSQEEENLGINFSEEEAEDDSYLNNFSEVKDGDLVRLGETIKSLRLDREQLIKKVQDLEKSQSLYEDDYLTIQAQLDEKKIENSILKKRYAQQIEDLSVRLELATNKKAVLEEKNKSMEKEYFKLRKEQKLDINKVRSRERELEDKLELLRKDAEVQIRNRDQKILELKRRIDTLEFDIENAHIKEKQSLSEQAILEGKIGKVISTLRNAIGQFEDESPLEQRRKKIKSNLDV